MFTLKRISIATIATIIIIFATIIARALGILDKTYTNIIIDYLLAIQMAFILISIIIYLISRRRLNGIKIIRYQLYDTPVKGETNILPENITPTNPRKSAIFKFFLEIENMSDTELPEIGILKESVGKFMPDIKKHIINVKCGVVNNSFIFDVDIIVKPDEEINVQIRKDTVIKSFFLGEFYIP